MLKNKVKPLKNLKYTIPALLLVLLLSSSAFNIYYLNRIYPGISISGINVGGRTRPEAISLLKDKLSAPEKITVNAKDKTYELSLKDVDFGYDYEVSAENAYSVYRNGNQLSNYISGVGSLTRKEDLEPGISLNDEKLEEYLEIVASQLKVEPVKPSVKMIKGEISVDKGLPGQQINKELFKSVLKENLRKGSFGNIEISFVDSNPALTDEEAVNYRKRAENLIGKKVNLKHEYDTFVITDREIMDFLNAPQGYDENSIKKYIKSLSPKINREPQDAAFKFENGKVEEFKPAKEGAVINDVPLMEEIERSLTLLETQDIKEYGIEVPIKSTRPKITTEEVNDLGIKELIGRGTSKFVGSIAGRVHNVGLASSKLNGVLVPPGETFSFNNAVGDVSVLTGYKQAYIIKDGRTVLGDGGGLCQVSTTLFRAALNAGLPILERRAHSYRVGYYEQDSGPGIDATVFSPTTDFKFKNDTPGYILIQTIFSAKDYSLVFEIYGTSDGRVASITKPVLSNVSAPPPDLYVDDPTLPAGQIKQIEHKAWGAKATFSYKVERNGEVLTDKVFVSNYRPWQAVYMKGIGPAI